MALDLDREAAFESISMGVAQIMGFNYKDVGYATAEAMFRAFLDSTALQILAFFDFVESQDLTVPLQLGRLVGFAAGYNGTGKPKWYADRILEAFQLLRPGKQLPGIPFRAN